MRIGVLGSGLMGGKLGTLFARAGHDVVFSYSHSEQKLKRLARQGGERAKAGTPSDAVRHADAILLAVHWSRVDDVLKQAGSVSGKVIVSCSLPMTRDDSELAIATHRPARRRWRRRRVARTSCRRSVRFPAKCCSASSTNVAVQRGPAWCIAEITAQRNRSRRS